MESNYFQVRPASSKPGVSMRQYNAGILLFANTKQRFLHSSSKSLARLNKRITQTLCLIGGGFTTRMAI